MVKRTCVHARTHAQTALTAQPRFFFVFLSGHAKRMHARMHVHKCTHARSCTHVHARTHAAHQAFGFIGGAVAAVSTFVGGAVSVGVAAIGGAVAAAGAAVGAAVGVSAGVGTAAGLAAAANTVGSAISAVASVFRTANTLVGLVAGVSGVVRGPGFRGQGVRATLRTLQNFIYTFTVLPPTFIHTRAGGGL